MKHMELTAPQAADVTVRNLKFYEQYYFQNGSEVSFLAKPRMHNGLVYVKACTLDIYLPNGEVLQAEPGDLLFLPKGSCYRTVFSNVTAGAPTYLFNCDLELDGIDFSLSSSVALIRTDRMDELDAIIEKAQTAKDAPFVLKSCFFALLAIWWEESTQPEVISLKDHTILTPAVEYIAAHTEAPISIALLAELCHMSQSFFRKKFGEAFGMSPKTYCLQKRLDRAKALLELGELNVSQVSDLLGFSSPSYFSRIFRKKFGAPPVERLHK